MYLNEHIPLNIFPFMCFYELRLKNKKEKKMKELWLDNSHK